MEIFGVAKHLKTTSHSQIIRPSFLFHLNTSMIVFKEEDEKCGMLETAQFNLVPGTSSLCSEH